jgi:hypothetical protein
MDEFEFPEDLLVCIDEYVDEEVGFDEMDVPMEVSPQDVNRDELALARYKLWQNGQQLRIRFMDGDAELHARVEAEARKWLEFANLEFEFGNFANAEIRISFKGSGYRSLVGTDALQRPQSQPTMILGGFTKHTGETLLRRVVIHEFGHAIGCVHEQSSPVIKIPWDKERVYAYYATHGWDKAKVDHNVFRRYDKLEVFFPEHHDPFSIMQYPVPNELTIGDFEIGWNTELSDTDKMFIKKMYPPV